MQCPAGTIALSGSSVCSACSNGQYSTPGSSACQTCSSS
jgi:hypothetical protein